MTNEYKMGQESKLQGLKPEDCPFHFESEEYAEWMNGYFDEVYEDSE